MRKYLLVLLMALLMLFAFTACDDDDDDDNSVTYDTTEDDASSDSQDENSDSSENGTSSDSQDESSESSTYTMELVDELLAVMDEADDYVDDYCTSAEVEETYLDEDGDEYTLTVTKYFVDTDGDGDLDDDETVVFQEASTTGFGYIYSYTSDDGLSAVYGTWTWENGTYTDSDDGEYSYREQSRYADFTIILSGTEYTLELEYTCIRYKYSSYSVYDYISAAVSVNDVEIDETTALAYMHENW